MQPSVKSAERVLDIIELLAREPAGLSFTALLRTLQLPKSSLHELLGVLIRRGYITLAPDTRSYTLGLRIWESGQAYLRQHDLASEARPIMDEIVRTLNETVQLAVLDGVENVYLAIVNCTHALRLQSEVGKRLPAYATGLGKVLLAHLDAAELARRLDGQTLARYTPNTITDMSALLERLDLVRRNGFAVDNQEYTPGLRCVAVPITDNSGQTVAAMSVSIPLLRTPSPPFHETLRALAVAGLSLSRRLGCQVDDARLVRLQDPLLTQDLLDQFALPEAVGQVVAPSSMAL
jgi:DNA-binding IclR family transcriptional regulator